MQNTKLKRAVWACNIVVAILCVVAIISFFFLPFWRIKISYTVKAEIVENMIGDSVDFDAEEIVGKDGVKISLGLEFKTGVLFKSYGKVETAVDALVEDNVQTLVKQMTTTLNSLVEKVVRTVTSDIVTKQVHDNIKNLLAESNPAITDEDVSQKLNDIGITDEFIASKTNAIIDKIYGGGSTVDGVCDEVIDTIDEIFERVTASSDLDLQGAEFTDEDKEALRKTVKDTMGSFAAEDGALDANELIASIFLQAIGSLTGGSKGSSSAAAQNSAAITFAEEDESAENAGDGQSEKPEGTEGATASERLEEEINNFMHGLIPSELYGILAWVMRAMTIMFLFSAFWWGYILLKLFVKALRRKKPKVQKNPTVKLWTPIVFGWLPFLVFMALPSVVLKVGMRFLTGLLPSNAVSIISEAGISFFTAGLVAFIIAMVFFGIGIFNIVARKKLKKAAAAEAEAEKGEAEEDSARESAPAAQAAQYNGYPNNAYPNGGYPNNGYPDNGYPNNGYQNYGYQNNGYQNYGYQDNGYQNNGYSNDGYPNQSSDDDSYYNY